ncbi:AAA family ATPase [Shewanella sp. SG44-6]|jgi:cobaltochelatase CobS|uniref:AAA family ATPase n=1 Tax=Shewanella sp. SG44-6 TaxID=2760959 RepID=UPI0015FF7D1D|nr:AAA family ATPase [Shewanella sp. SG44-6]MBB1392014.1 AAA family ATPase [Shewanella sp. SG44-6]
MQNVNVELVAGDLVFPGLGFEGRKIARLSTRSPLVPTCNKNYKPCPRMLNIALTWMFAPKRNTSFSLFGETGTGKTEFWTYICDKLNWPMVIVSVSESLKPESVKSGLVMRNGNTHHELSAAAQAAEMGAMLVLDEMDKGSLDFLAALHPLMEYKGLPLEKQGRVITPHPLFRLVATCQTNGCGDLTGRYQSTSSLDEAVRRRFMWLESKYPAPEVEYEILLAEAPKIKSKVLRMMARFAEHCRNALDADDSSEHRVFSALSTRIMVDWVRMQSLMKDFSIAEVFDIVFLNACELEDKQTFTLLAELAFGEQWLQPAF